MKIHRINKTNKLDMINSSPRVALQTHRKCNDRWEYYIGGGDEQGGVRGRLPGQEDAECRHKDQTDTNQMTCHSSAEFGERRNLVELFPDYVTGFLCFVHSQYIPWLLRNDQRETRKPLHTHLRIYGCYPCPKRHRSTPRSRTSDSCADPLPIQK